MIRWSRRVLLIDPDVDPDTDPDDYDEDEDDDEDDEDEEEDDDDGGGEKWYVRPPADRRFTQIRARA